MCVLMLFIKIFCLEFKGKKEKRFQMEIKKKNLVALCFVNFCGEINFSM